MFLKYRCRSYRFSLAVAQALSYPSVTATPCFLPALIARFSLLLSALQSTSSVVAILTSAISSFRPAKAPSAHALVCEHVKSELLPMISHISVDFPHIWASIMNSMRSPRQLSCFWQIPLKAGGCCDAVMHSNLEMPLKVWMVGRVGFIFLVSVLSGCTLRVVKEAAKHTFLDVNTTDGWLQVL